MAIMKITVTEQDNPDFQDKLMSMASMIQKNAMAQVKPKAIMKAKLIVRGAVDAYYGSYGPQVYSRTESLYSVMEVQETGDGFDLMFGGEYMKGSHRVGNDYIYDVMFKKGYHGGAPHNGDYYWRWPSPQTLSESGIPPYSMWYLWGPAPQSASPWEQIYSEWMEYINGEGKQLLLNAIRSEVAKVKGVS